jgi:peptide deformylase
MALLEVLKYPDTALKTQADEVSEVDDEVRQLLTDMAETMYAAPGVGLAATQVGRAVRAVVLDVPPPEEEAEQAEEGGEAEAPEEAEAEGPRSRLLCLVNPEIVQAEGEVTWEEGCLSVPGVYEDVKRKAKVVVEALDADGQPLTIEAEGLLAVALQHEIDHLDGVLFIDRLPPVKRRLVKRKIEKMIEEGTYPPPPEE